MQVWVLPTATLSTLKIPLEKQLAARGIPAGVEIAPFGEMELQALGEGSSYRRAAPEMTILVPDSHDLLGGIFESPLACDRKARDAALDHAAARVSAVLAATASVSRWVLLCTGAWPPVNPLGLLESDPALSLQELTAEYNRRIVAAAGRYGNVAVVDYAGLVMQAGYERFHDPRLWTLARMRLSAEGISRLANHLARVVAALDRRPRKCIVVDLDNTLWGGILGEEGIEGIRIGEDGIGLAFAQFQRELLAIRARGVLLAIASKNDEEQALDVFRRHPGMVLRLEHFAAHRIGWQPKSESLAAIAEQLGFDSRALVFIDDSAHERESVRRAFPDVAVLDLPTDPALYVAALRSCEELDAVQVTDEDRKRNEMVAAENQRTRLRAEMPDLTAFLRSLGQQAILEPLGESNIPRAAQLCQRTNQYNLTLRRHDAAALHRLAAGEHAGILLRARDKLGDSGLVGFALALPASDGVWELDTFILSCRVIGRGLETALLAEVARAVVAHGGTQLRARFVLGPRNSVCAKLLPEHGFDPLGAEHDYTFPVVARPLTPPDYIDIQWSTT
jgi:FkbH-like protein